MKLRICAVGTMLGALVLWACSSSSSPGTSGGVNAPDPGEDGGGPGVTGDASSEGGTSTAGLVFVPDPDGLCSRIIACEDDAGADAGGADASASLGGPGLTQADCLLGFKPTKFTQTCVAALSASTCADIVGNFPAYSACFPSCGSPGSAKCNGDGTLTGCGKGGETFVFDCARLCETQKLTFSGTCGSSFNGQPSKTGQDQCWCK